MTRRTFLAFALAGPVAVAAVSFAVSAAVSPPPTVSPGTRLLGWNNLGMHCMDADFGIFSILPPYNTIHAQLVLDGSLVRSPAGMTVTYEAVTDANGSINTASSWKTNFWQNAQALFGATPAAETGLAGKAMPGAANAPQAMTWDAAANGWFAEGIPITPTDDAGHRNAYPMMRLVARDASQAVLATTDIVLPVSDELDCSACHASGASPSAMPSAGWVNDPDPQRDFRLNVLRRHDDLASRSPAWAPSLAASGYDAAGLYATATVAHRPVLCASCHASNALGTAGHAGVPQLTTAIHGFHAIVRDPTNGLALDAVENRSACYRCHPGAVTRCLRGAMGAAVAPDGAMSMQCQSCHGSMLAVGAQGRRGWLDEPTCQSCHTGTAVSNNGQIRYLDAYDSGQHWRDAADATFATNADTPMAGVSLFRASSGHGGLACEACHGSTHAEFPSSHASDNVQSVAVQGHAGMLVECAACHGSAPDTSRGGPHGMHPVGAAWVDRHPDALESGGAGLASCRDCHGGDYRGTVLSRAQADRVLQAFGTHRVFRGQIIGCWTCHDGPGSERANPSRAPVALDASAATGVGVPVGVPLVATDRPGSVLTYRIVSQPAHGTAGLLGAQATYFPEAGFVGTDAFTFAARDGFVDSNLATVQVAVGGQAAAPDFRAVWISLRVRRINRRMTLDGVLAVSNVGAAPAAASVASIGVSPDGAMHPGDTALRTVPVAALKPGQERRVQVRVALPKGTSVSGNFVIAAANAGGTVTAVNPANDVAVRGPMK